MSIRLVWLHCCSTSNLGPPGCYRPRTRPPPWASEEAASCAWAHRRGPPGQGWHQSLLGWQSRGAERSASELSLSLQVKAGGALPSQRLARRSSGLMLPVAVRRPATVPSAVLLIAAVLCHMVPGACAWSPPPPFSSLASLAGSRSFAQAAAWMRGLGGCSEPGTPDSCSRGMVNCFPVHPCQPNGGLLWPRVLYRELSHPSLSPPRL